MRISIIGIPGAGKSTLADTLGNMLRIMHISSGALARAHGFAGSEAEKQGKLDPNEDKIQQLVKDAVGSSTHYILDGFPRTLAQIGDVVPIDAVVYLDVYSAETAISRLLDRGRPDDTLEIITRRIQTYYEHTYPLVDHFSKKHKLISIDASGTMGYTVGQTMTQLHNLGILEATQYIKKIIKNYGKESKTTVDRDRTTSEEGETG